jgi:hypothetical protein
MPPPPRARPSVELEETPWPSFADALAAMLFIFIVTTFWFSQRMQIQENAASQEVKRLKGAEVAAGNLLTGVGLCLDQADSADYKTRSIVEPGTRTLSLYIEWTGVSKAQTLAEWFPGCSAAIKPEADVVIGQARSCLSKELPALFDEYTVTLTLEGHTDARAPAGACAGIFPSNWELSGARAGAVLRRMLCQDGVCQDGAAQQEAGQLAAWSQDRSRLQMVAAGRADSVPAWRSLCNTQWQGAGVDEALDKDVCALLEKQAGQVDAQLTSRVAVGLEGLLAAPLDSPSTALIRWANDPRCNWNNPEPLASTCQNRLGRMRRVDMRVELHPRLENQ